MDTFPIYTPVQLLGLFVEDNQLPTFWRNLCFGNAPIYSDDKDIEFSKSSTLRRVAPVVSPESEGLPIYNARAAVRRVRPAYTKLLDAVRPGDFTGKRVVPNEVGAGVRAMTPAERWASRVAEILRQHSNAIDTLIELMCFQAVSTGVVRVVDDETGAINIVNFGRSAAHTITLGAGLRWDEAGSDPLADIENWKALAAGPKGPQPEDRFGAAPTVWVMGRAAAKAFRKNVKVKAELDLNYRRPDQSVVQTGVLNGARVEYIGSLNNGDQLWMYDEYTEDAAGTQTLVMDTRDVIGVNPAAFAGTIAYGTIENFNADLATLERFPSMYANTNGSAIYLQNESAPLPIAVNPNATLRARVLA